ncbi:MAG: protein kinase [Planctomycetota bacterium]
MFERGFSFAPGYRLDKFLGRGQFGQVWSVQAPGGTLAAVKFFDLSEASSRKEYEGIKRIKQIRQANLMPITAIWQLDHRGHSIEEFAPPSRLTSVTRSSEHPPEPGDSSDVDQATMSLELPEPPSWLAVAMLLGGQSLLRLLKQAKANGHSGIGVKELIGYMQDAAKGLDFLNAPQHDLGVGLVSIQHCDVKPANIVTLGNSAVICDFGLAKILRRHQATATSAAGTPAFMAPEAIEGRPGSTSDQYSLAITYYQLRTGKLPTDGQSVYAIMDQHRSGQLDFSAVDGAERDVLIQATRVDFTQRYPDCCDFVDRLRDAVLRSVDDAVLTGDPSTVSESEDAFSGELIEPVVGNLNEAEHGDASTSSHPYDSTRHRRRLAFIGIVAIVGCLMTVLATQGTHIWLRPQNELSRQSADNEFDDKETVVGLDNADTEAIRLSLSDVLDLWESDQAAAVDAFSRLMASEASVTEPKVWTIPGDDPLQAVFVAGRDRILTLGYQPSPRLFTLPLKLNALEPSAAVSSVGVTDLTRDDGIIYPQAIAIKSILANQQRSNWVLLGGEPPLTIWRIAEEQSPQEETLAPLPLETPNGLGEVLAATWHPVSGVENQTSQMGTVFAAADDQGQLLVGTVGADQIARVDLISIPWIPIDLTSSMDGRWLVALTEDNDVFKFRWNDVIASRDRAASPSAYPAKAPGTRAHIIKAFSTSIDPPPVVNTGQSQMLAIGDDQGSVSVWSLSSERESESNPSLVSRTQPHQQAVDSLSIGRFDNQPVIVSGSDDGSLHAWQPTSESPISRRLQVGSSAINATSVSADGRWAVAATFGQIILWDWNALGEDFGGSTYHPLSIDGVDIVDVMSDPDDHYVIAAGDDGNLRIFDLRHLCLLAITSPNQPASDVLIEPSNQNNPPRNDLAGLSLEL